MPQGQLFQVMRRVRRLLDPLPADDTADAQLLRRFAQRREERAFEVLLDRHGPLVIGLCRRVLRHEQDAEDAFQATFLLLARKAGSIRNQESVGSWLYGVAFRVASQAKRAAARRQVRERSADEEPSGSEVEPAEVVGRRELDAVLDEEVQRLPAKYRLPIVLCCLQGKSNEDAARELGWPKGTVQGRLARARDCLRRRLERRGVALGLGIAGAEVVPRALADGTVQGASRFAEGASLPEVVTGNAVVLVQGVLRNMFLAKVKAAVTLLLVAVGIAGGSGAITYRMATAEQARAAPLEPKDSRELQSLVKIPSRFDGVLEEVVVKEGQKVRKGEVLGKLDDRAAAAEVKIAEARIVAAKAALQTANDTKKIAYNIWKTMERLVKNAGASHEELDKAKLAYNRECSEVVHKQNDVEIAKLERERALVFLEQHTIRSPCRGVVRKIEKKVGEAVHKLETVFVVQAEDGK